MKLVKVRSSITGDIVLVNLDQVKCIRFHAGTVFIYISGETSIDITMQEYFENVEHEIN